MMYLKFNVAAIREFSRYFTVAYDWDLVEDFLGAYYAGGEL